MERVPIKSILCPVDFSKFSVRAYNYASSLARHYGATLFVQHVVELWRHPSACFAATADEYNDFRGSLVTSAEDRLRCFVQASAVDGLHPELVIQEDWAIDCILSFAENKAADLIVIGTHGVRGFDRLVLGSVTEKVLRKARCSVLAVHQTPQNPSSQGMAQHGIELREILFCTDLSDLSNGAFDYALSVATEYKANLTLVHVVEGNSKSHCSEKMEKANDVLDRLVPREVKDNSGISKVVRVGKPYREITQFANEKAADLVIMAMHGSDSLDDAVFGSTTYRVVQLGTCPVLAVHPEARTKRQGRGISSADVRE